MAELIKSYNKHFVIAAIGNDILKGLVGKRIGSYNRHEMFHAANEIKNMYNDLIEKCGYESWVTVDVSPYNDEYHIIITLHKIGENEVEKFILRS